MKAGGGGQKGAGFERQVCKHLSRWASGGHREDVFWRSASSGGRATNKRKRGEAHTAAAQAGDIVATSDEGMSFTKRFFIECKFYANLSLPAFLLGKRVGVLHKFWEVAQREASAYGKSPLLIAKQNNEKAIVLTAQAVGETAPILYIIPAQTYVYWFDELFPAQPPLLRKKTDVPRPARKRPAPNRPPRR